MDQDLDHLRLLAVFHYVAAAVVGLISLVPVIHLVVGLALLTGGLPASHDGSSGERFLGSLFVGCAAVWMLLGLSFAVCLVFAGRYLAQRRRYLFCLVVAAVLCLFMPVGTLLGVLTLVVLLRPSVKELFGEVPHD